jgi:sec-independent protein translocase protein TatA
MGPLGIPEMIFIFVFALLIFGPKKLPELGKSFGKGMAEFRRASNELKSTFQGEMDNIERETTEVKEVAKQANAELNKQISTTNYEDSEDDYYSEYDDTTYQDSGAKDPASSESAAASSTENPAVNSDSNVGPSDDQSAPVTASNASKPAASSANAETSEAKAS